MHGRGPDRCFVVVEGVTPRTGATPDPTDDRSSAARRETNPGGKEPMPWRPQESDLARDGGPRAVREAWGWLMEPGSFFPLPPEVLCGTTLSTASDGSKPPGSCACVPSVEAAGSAGTATWNGPAEGNRASRNCENPPRNGDGSNNSVSGRTDAANPPSICGRPAAPWWPEWSPGRRPTGSGLNGSRSWAPRSTRTSSSTNCGSTPNGRPRRNP